MSKFYGNLLLLAGGDFTVSRLVMDYLVSSI